MPSAKFDPLRRVVCTDSGAKTLSPNLRIGLPRRWARWKTRRDSS